MITQPGVLVGMGLVFIFIIFGRIYNYFKKPRALSIKNTVVVCDNLQSVKDEFQKVYQRNLVTIQKSVTRQPYELWYKDDRLIHHFYFLTPQQRLALFGINIHEFYSVGFSTTKEHRDFLSYVNKKYADTKV